MKFNYNGQEIELKYTMRSMLKWENKYKRTFNPITLGETVYFFYCVLTSSKRDMSFDYEKFEDILDDNPQLFGEFAKWIANVQLQNNMFNTVDEKEVKKEDIDEKN